jgi:hypothetical protein
MANDVEGAVYPAAMRGKRWTCGRGQILNRILTSGDVQEAAGSPYCAADPENGGFANLVPRRRRAPCSTEFSRPSLRGPSRFEGLPSAPASPDSSCSLPWPPPGPRARVSRRMSSPPRSRVSHCSERRCAPPRAAGMGVGRSGSRFAGGVAGPTADGARGSGNESDAGTGSPGPISVWPSRLGSRRATGPVSAGRALVVFGCASSIGPPRCPFRCSRTRSTGRMA